VPRRIETTESGGENRQPFGSAFHSSPRSGFSQHAHLPEDQGARRIEPSSGGEKIRRFEALATRGGGVHARHRRPWRAGPEPASTQGRPVTAFHESRKARPWETARIIGVHVAGLKRDVHTCQRDSRHPAVLHNRPSLYSQLAPHFYNDAGEPGERLFGMAAGCVDAGSGI
jgi:hypothetical protein